MIEPTRLHKPAPRLTLIALALAGVPAEPRELLRAAFKRLSSDPGWNPEARALALVIAAIAGDLSRPDADLAAVLEKVEGMEVGDPGTLADLLPEAR